MRRQIERIRLLQAAGSGHVLVVAGGGYGKTVLLRQIASSAGFTFVSSPKADRTLANFATVVLGDASNAASPDVLAAALHAHRPGLAIDDIEHWDADVHHVIELLLQRGSECRIVAAARIVPPSMVGAFEMRLDESDLRFDETELAEMIAAASDDPALLPVIDRITNGWPELVAQLATAMDSAEDPASALRDAGRTGMLTVRTLAPYLDSLPPEQQDQVRVLARLPRFDARTAAVVGGADLLTQVRAAGLSVRERADGYLELPAAVRVELTRRDPSSKPLTDELLQHLVTSGDIQTAINACVGDGDTERAAELIASLGLADEATLDPTELNAAMEMIGAAADLHPRSLYVQAHVNALNGRSREGLVAIERAAAVFDEIDPDDTRRDHIETLLVLGMFRGFSRQPAEAQGLLERAEHRVDEGRVDLVTGYLHDLRGLIAYTSLGDAGLETARDELTKALGVWRRLREPRLAAGTTFRLATSILSALGQRTEAVALLDSLPSVGPMTALIEARLAIEKASLLPFIGRADEVAELVMDARRVAEALNQGWILGWAHAAEVTAASVLADDQEAAELARAYRDQRYVIQSPVTTAGFDGLVAVSSARVGEFDCARQLLAKMRETPGVPEWVLSYTEASVRIRSGDCSPGLTILESLDLHDGVDRSILWDLDLLRSYAHWQLGNLDESIKYREQAQFQAQQLGQPELPEILEWRILNTMAGISAAVDSGTRVQLFNEFAVSVGDATVELSSKLGATLIKVLSVKGGQVVVDQIVDVLWPEVDLTVGRRRLRNVLVRIREACGDIVERSGETLRLAGSVRSDYSDAAMEAASALRSRDLDELHRAIECNDQALLPFDRYADWAEDARAEHRERVIKLLDVHAEVARDAGEKSAAAQSLARADELSLIPTRASRIDALGS